VNASSILHSAQATPASVNRPWMLFFSRQRELSMDLKCPWTLHARPSKSSSITCLSPPPALASSAAPNGSALAASRPRAPTGAPRRATIDRRLRPRLSALTAAEAAAAARGAAAGKDAKQASSSSCSTSSTISTSSTSSTSSNRNQHQHQLHHRNHHRTLSALSSAFGASWAHLPYGPSPSLERPFNCLVWRPGPGELPRQTAARGTLTCVRAAAAAGRAKV
jgi:hypothetical protein